MKAPGKVNRRTVELTRVLDAPRERVFAAWTRAEHLVHWFGPKGFSLHSCEADPRPGGIFRLVMRSPEGKDYRVRGSYRTVVAPEHLVIECTADDAQGVTRLEEVIDVRFTEQDGRTTLKLHASAAGDSAEAKPMLEGMEQGWHQTIDRLDQSL